MKRVYKGFTLIELLVVIAIIGLLSTLAVVALNSARQRSRDAKRVADIRQIQTALELGFSEVSSYPPVNSATTLGTGDAVRLCQSSATVQSWTNAAGSTATAPGAACSSTGTTYMGLVPANPTPNGAAYVYTSLNSDASACTAAAGCSRYRITFNLEGQTGSLGSGNNCANPSGITAGTGC